MNLVLNWLAFLGRPLRESIEGLGFATRFFFNLLRVSPGAMRRPGLISEQTHFIGNYSLVIIIVSGLFVGMVLGLQGYYTLQAYGAEQALGQVVALALVRELGPVVTALLFAGLDPISMGVTANLIRRLNDALGSTSLLVSHDVHECFAIADYVYFMSAGKIVAQGTPADLRVSDDPYVKQFVNAEPDGPVPFHYPGASFADDLGLGAPR